jgi:hypothetical protein
VSPSSRISLLVFLVLAIVLCLLPRESHYLSFLFWRLYCVSFLENLITCLFCFGDCIVSPSSRISLLVVLVLAIVLCLLPRESHYLSFLFWRLYCVSFLENLITCLSCFGDCIVSPSSRISLLVFFVLAIVLCLLPRQSHYLYSFDILIQVTSFP